MPIMTTSKQQIIEKAIALASQGGLSEVSISMLANACGLQKSSLYTHFASKKAIEDAVLMHCRKALASEVNSLSISGKNLHDSLLDIAFFLYSIFSDEDTGLCYTLIQSEKLRNEEAGRIAIQIFNMLTARCEVLLDRKTHLDDCHSPAFLFCSGLENLIGLFLLRQKEGENWEEFSWEIEKYCDGFLHLLQERHPDQGESISQDLEHH
jgi:AcrR family transcriptional regulator